MAFIRSLARKLVSQGLEILLALPFTNTLARHCEAQARLSAEPTAPEAFTGLEEHPFPVFWRAATNPVHKATGAELDSSPNVVRCTWPCG